MITIKRKLLCEISPYAYRISVAKCIFLRKIKNIFSPLRFASQKSEALLPILVYQHASLIRRTLGNVDMRLQENKAVNLSLAAPKISHIVIAPGETFSFWHLVDNPSEKFGYQEGLTISAGQATSGIGGGMCQFTNLIHWMILHSPLEITEHHHHDGIDLFPDFNRQIPFGTGTSIMYNYLDYRFKNNTDLTYQLVTYTTDVYLCGELRADQVCPTSFHIKAEDKKFVTENNIVYRLGHVYREEIDKRTGALIAKSLIRTNHARVMYDISDRTTEA